MARAEESAEMGEHAAAGSSLTCDPLGAPAIAGAKVHGEEAAATDDVGRHVAFAATAAS